MINLIWAMDENWLVGKDNLLPWRYAEDLIYFKKITSNKRVLMGHNTYKSMKHYYNNKPFPFSEVYVATSQQITYEDCFIVNDVIAFLQDNKEELFIIGGPKIYDLAMPFARRLYITYVLDRHVGNVYFTKFNLSKFKLVSSSKVNKLIFAIYERSENNQ